MASEPEISQYRIPESNCLNCGKVIGSVTNVAGYHVPTVGSVSICIYCGHVMEFGIGLILIKASDETLQMIAADEDFLTGMKVVSLFNKEKK
jgi:hypothetical protein